MPLLIQKYGGKSLATPDDIKQVARLIHERVKSGDQIVVVVSAMGETTDHYLSMARSVSQNPAGRELDILLSTGERIAIAMLALALNGIEQECAVSLTGAQAGIITDTNYTAARIVEIRPVRVREVLEQNKIPVIAGYQGITIDKNISTLGRGGTDLTAVSMAVALGAERVEFMKDVDGISTADPKKIPTARVLEQVSYTEALDMMGFGGKIIQASAMELAVEHKLPLSIGNSKTGVVGTIVTDKPMLRRTLTSVTVSENADCLHCASLDDFYGVSASLRERGVLPLVAIQSEDSYLIVTPRGSSSASTIGYNVQLSNNLDLVTLIGPGVGGAGDLAASVQELTASFKTKIRALNSTESRVSVLLPSDIAIDFAKQAHELCLTTKVFSKSTESLK